MLEQVERQPVRLIGVGVYNLSGEEGRQLTIEELLPFGDGEQQLKDRLDFLRRSYRLDFAGHLEQLYHMETLHKTVEYMRKHPPTR